MLLFAHTGITLGAALVAARLTVRERFVKNRKTETGETHPEQSSLTITESDCGETTRPSWVGSLAGYADIRLVLVGSLLPDIIDKPVGQLFFWETFGNGRIFSHTILFLVLIALSGLYLYRHQKKTWLLALSFGTFMHLILDEMWLAPRTLLWPAYGFIFDRIQMDHSHWTPDMYYAPLLNPRVYIPELIGAAIVIWFALLLVRKRNVFAFIKYGKVE